ncbi:hypothetical protein TNCV_4790041 [Trichonephila clavipes]|nr:hypothetical protein TNCV_4790041 [Trichonephila clavipes]
MIVNISYNSFNNYDDPKHIVENPFIPISIVILYTVFVIWIGPFIMKFREPYKLKKVVSGLRIGLYSSKNDATDCVNSVLAIDEPCATVTWPKLL